MNRGVLVGLLLQLMKQSLRFLDEFLALFNKALKFFNVFDVDVKRLQLDCFLPGGHNGSPRIASKREYRKAGYPTKRQ